jgi:hypothetical protein
MATTYLSKPFRTRDDGTVQTVADAIVEHLAAGNYVETAAAAVGVNRTNLFRLLARGAKALAANARTGKAIPKSEKVYAEFVDRVQVATAQAEARAVDAIARLAEGGLTLRETSVEFVIGHDDDGNEIRTEVKRTETTKALAPNFRAIAWRLERRNPKHWGRGAALETMDADGAPKPTREERIDAIEAALAGFPDDYLAGYEDGKAAAVVDPV